jgi:hypothetical protein
VLVETDGGVLQVGAGYFDVFEMVVAVLNGINMSFGEPIFGDVNGFLILLDGAECAVYQLFNEILYC